MNEQEQTGAAVRVTMHEAKRHFEAGGAVLVSEYGHEPTQTVTASTTTHDRTSTTWDALAADVKEWRNRYPNQRFYIVPTVDACTCSTDEDDELAQIAPAIIAEIVAAGIAGQTRQAPRESTIVPVNESGELECSGLHHAAES